MYNQLCYHIYVNDRCYKANLHEEDFEKELNHLHTFLELTNLQDSARIEYEECDVPKEFTEASY